MTVILSLNSLRPSGCEVCGESPVEGHHEDYLRPHEVVWLCKKHHIERHVQIRAEGKDLNHVLTPRKVATLLGFRPRTITRWCRDGQIEAHKVGRVWRITEKELLRIYEQGLRSVADN